MDFTCIHELGTNREMGLMVAKNMVIRSEINIIRYPR